MGHSLLYRPFAAARPGWVYGKKGGVWLMRQIFLALAMAYLLLPSGAAAEELTGKKIIEEVRQRHARPVEFEIQRLTLTDKNGTEQVRSLKRYSRTVGPGEQRYLMVFHSPKTIRGAAIVTWKRRFKKDGQWLYLPANGGKPVRVLEGNKTNFVMGTDFTGEDLSFENPDDLEFERQTDEVIDGDSHYVVDVTAKDKTLKQETGYKFRRLWIDKKNYFVMRTDYYDRRGKLVKRQTASDVKKIEDDMWRATVQVMENFEKKHKTQVEVLERDFDVSSVPVDIFFQRTLISGDHVR